VITEAGFSKHLFKACNHNTASKKTWSLLTYQQKCFHVNKKSINALRYFGQISLKRWK